MDESTQDDLFLDAVEAIVLDALARIGDDPKARFAFFKRLLAVAEEEAGGRYLLWGFHPATGPARGHGRANLQSADLAAALTPYFDWQPAGAQASDNHRSQIELRPTVAGLAVGRESVVVIEQVGEAA